MSWLRIDDGFTEHPKILSLAPRDRWTWLSILTYCARYRTAGYVPPQISEAVRGATPALLNRLWELHLLDLDGEREGYAVHDWAIYNGENVAEKVAAYVTDHPDASANEVAKAVGGTRNVVLAEVARIKARTGTRTGTDAGTDAGTDVVRPNQASGTESGSESGTRACLPSPTPTERTTEGSNVVEKPFERRREARPEEAETGDDDIFTTTPYKHPYDIGRL